MRVLKAKDPPRPKNPLVHLSFDQMEGGTIPLASKLALEAKCEGACELRGGKFGKAVRLDGKTARILLQGADANGLNLKDFTLSVWVNAESVTERKGVISRQKWPAGYALFFWNGSVAAEAGSREGSTQCRTHDSLCRAGAWYHLAATVESGKAITLYVDGEEVKRSEMQQPAGAADAPFLIGWNGWGGRQNDPSPGPFVGLVDELRVWDRVLSADEVLAEAASEP